MKTIQLLLCLLLATCVPRFAFADLVGPYTPDANTLVLLHMDSAQGTSVVPNAGSLGGNFYSVNGSGNPASAPQITTMLGVTGYSVNLPTAVSYSLAMTNPLPADDILAYDYNNDGVANLSGNSSTNPDFIKMSVLNMGNGSQTPWTMECLVQPTTTSPSGEIMCSDTAAITPYRGFQFKITTTSGAAQLNFTPIAPYYPTNTTSPGITGNIPTTGNDAIVAGAWYHVAVTYDGTNVYIYWTLLNSTNGACHLISTTPLSLGVDFGNNSGLLCIGNSARNANSGFTGSIDEVRFSNICRPANQMQFYSPLVSITQQPAALQNVDYNQPVSFSVGASTTGSTLGYQWRFNSNNIAGATGTTYGILSVAAFNAGYYDCMVTNTAGYTNVTVEAEVVVGAANFLSHRYSFAADDTDSIGGANGTNFGDAYISGGQLVLDGTANTFMQLPPFLFNSASGTALTVEFWATFGVNSDNAVVYDFGSQASISGHLEGQGFLDFVPDNLAGLPESRIGSLDLPSAQLATASSALDGLTVHVACVYDPPDNTMAIYTNGVLAAINTNETVALSAINDGLSYVGRSLDVDDGGIGGPATPYFSGSIDELRIYQGALAGLSIKQSEDQGPATILADGPGKFVTQPVGASVPVGQTATFTAVAVGYLPITYQWFKNGTIVPGATNASYSFATVIGDNNASLFCYATNTIGITTYVTNSSTATLIVFLPPTLTWLDGANGGADSSWNTTSLDWVNTAGGGGVIPFSQTNGALFDNRGSGSPTVDIEQAIIPYNITFNASTDYLLTSSGNAGSLVGQAAITKLNADTLTIDLTNNLSGAVTISGGKLQVGNGDSFGSLGSGAVTNNATLSFNRADAALNAGNSIHGSGTVSFDGGGSVTISGNSDYSGSSFINAGIVFLTSSTGLGSASSGTAVANGGQLYITANVDVAEALTLNGSGPDGNGALRKGGAGVTMDFGAVTLATAATIGVDTGATLTLSNGVSGAAALTANGGGTLALSANNTFNGGFTLNGPVVNLNANGALGTGPVTVSGAGRFVLADGLNLTNAILASAVSPGAATGLLMVNDNTNGTITTISGPLEFDVSPASGSDFVGPTSSGYLNVTGPITNTATGLVGSRSGFVRFSGGGNYTTFNLNQGTVSLGANNGLCTNANLAFLGSSDATFDLNGFSQALIGLSDAGTFLRLVTNNSPTLSTLSMNLSANSTYNGVIAGNVALVQNGSANLLLAGTNAYTGNTTVNGGTLELAQPGLAASSTVTVASGAMLQLDFAVTNQVAVLVLNGASQALGVYNSTMSPAFITGSGSLLVAVSVATNPTNLIAKVSGGNLILTWPADHVGWRLQSQTNSITKGIGTNWMDVAGSTTVNSVTNVINPVNGAVFYRMVYP